MKVSLRHGIALVVCLVAAGTARPEDDWAATRESFICRSSTEVREIKTYISNSPDSDRVDAHGCRVDYIKNGTTQTLWSSRTSRSFCDGKASQLAARLKRGNFSCDLLRSQRSDEG
jgi:hypothetical protein